MSNISVFSHGFSGKPESHEQDGETLSRARFARNETASGDPAMASRSSHSVSFEQPLPEALGGSLFEESRHAIAGR
jgi:hypothetical protein